MTDEAKTARKVVPLRGRRCPICDKPADARFRPFCSRRCADLDLGRWLGGDYRVPTDEPPESGGSGDEEGEL